MNYDEVLSSLQGIVNKSILVVVSNTMIERFNLSKCFNEMQLNNKVNFLKHVPANPTERDVKESLDTIDSKIDLVIAIGGGSTIDLAKCMIAFMYLVGTDYNSLVIKEYIKNKNYLKHNENIEFIAIPTTAGTGSEVTSWATVWDSSKENKMSVEADFITPTRAYIVPEFTLTLNKRLTLATGLDALCHATESYWAKSSNVISRELSKIAIGYIVDYLPQVLEEPENLYYRKGMCMGALFAGLAFANTRTTACHSISYPITIMYGVEHGFAVALTLVEVMEHNKDFINDFEGLLRAYKQSSIKNIRDWLSNICKDIQPLNMKAFGIHENDISKIIENSFTTGRMDNNTTKLTKEDIKSILMKVSC